MLKAQRSISSCLTPTSASVATNETTTSNTATGHGGYSARCIRIQKQIRSFKWESVNVLSLFSVIFSLRDRYPRSHAIFLKML